MAMIPPLDAVWKRYAGNGFLLSKNVRARDNVKADMYGEQKDRPRPLLTTTGRHSGMWPGGVGASSDTTDEVSFKPPDILDRVIKHVSLLIDVGCGGLVPAFTAENVYKNHGL